MSYELKFTDYVNKGSIIVEDKTINEETSISFPGRESKSYGQKINENFLHLLENFSGPFAPSRPVEGQLWYDTTEDVNQLKIYDGTNWVASGGLKKSANLPSVSNSTPGELWVNTESQQLYLFTGTGWILVGPDYSDGLLTGTESNTIIGTDNKEYNTLFIRVENEIVFIISRYEFVPKSSINGFRQGLKPGINISSIALNGKMKYWGTSEKSENLMVGNKSIPASQFLRSDVESSTNFRLRIKSNDGVTLGSEDQLLIGIEDRSSVIQNQLNGSNIDIRLRNDNQTPTIMRIDSAGLVGINNTVPEQALDVIGNISVAGDSDNGGALTVRGTEDSDNISTGSITTAGGIGIAKTLHVGNDIVVNGAIDSTNILPSENNIHTVGTPSLQYSSMHAQTFFGNLQGNVSGTVSGRSGSSDRLTSATTFSITGDVENNSFAFDGQTGGTTKSFDVRISNSFISNKEVVYETNNADEIIFNRRVGESGIFKVSKRNFLKDIPIMPPGILLPYGGAEPPDGWLFCDGSVVQKSDYNELWNVVGHNFKDPVLLPDGGVNTYALPDMRGRAARGLDNLGGISANRVSDDAANDIGGNAGSQNTIISIENLPDHDHTLQGKSGTQYYGIRTASGSTNDDEAITMQIEPGLGGTQGLPSSGGVRTDTNISQPINTMDPYLAVNYIIYTGKS